MGKKRQKKPDKIKTAPPAARRPFLPGSARINALIFLLLLIVTVALYAGTFHLGFFRIDDKQYVSSNPWIKGMTAENLRFIFTHPYFANYSPLHLFSYMLDYAIGGDNPFIYHLSSSIWAGLVAGFVYLAALALLQNRYMAIASAVLFVVHPVHVEAVAWISSRKDLVAAAFILPSLLAYLRYRKNPAQRKWYFISLLLFIGALAGKLSVAVFPAVFFAIDWFIEKRNFTKSLIDKIPFLLAAVLFTVMVAGAQPETGVKPDIVVFAKALLQSLWLLTGFGTYVIYREPPQPGNAFMTIVGAVAVAVIFILPFLLRRRYPLAVVLLYWILFTWLPTQVLSFVYPVTDRYLYLPSVAACILIAWIFFTLAKHVGKKPVLIAAASLSLIAVVWLKIKLDYIGEWRDSRSVWYGALKKSKDVQVYYNLGWHYLDRAASFGDKRRKAPLPENEAKQFAADVWKNDARLPALLAEIGTGKHDGPVEKEFKKYLQNQAMQYFDTVVANKGSKVMAEMYFHRGMLCLDLENYQQAKQEFSKAIDEASRMGFDDTRREVLVNSHFNMGIAEWSLKNYKEALPWIQLAEEEQNKWKGNWFPDISVQRKRLEDIIAVIYKQ
jgi:hypothetical protein